MTLFRTIVGVILIFLCMSIKAGEGLWLPYLLENDVLEDIHAKGCRLSAEDIFSINQASLNDAIVSFSGFCTASFISENGLIITNHHCGYDYIRSHSTVDRNYLNDGFWAKDQEEELPNPGAYVHILKKVEDVSEIVLQIIPDSVSYMIKQRMISDIIDSLEIIVGDSLNMKASIEGFYHNNAYYLFLYEEYKDVRLVGAPGSSIGKFGGETDNWMWPRHNADFSLFRVYTDTLGQAAEYDESNVPFHPLKYLTISSQGVQEGDFTMVFGYPGITYEYLTEAEVKYVYERKMPEIIKILDTKLNYLENLMKQNDQLKLMYASSYARTSNVWKKSKGVLFGMDAIDLVNVKKISDSLFIASVDDDETKKELDDILRAIERIYSEYQTYMLSRDVLLRTLFNMGFAEIVNEVIYTLEVLGLYHDDLMISLEQTGTEFYKNYIWENDLGLSVEMLTKYTELVPSQYFPEVFREKNIRDKDDIEKQLKKLFSKSLFKNYDSFHKALMKSENKGSAMLMNDPLSSFYYSFVNVYYELDDILMEAETQLDSLHSRYMKIVLTHRNGKRMYPDANGTFRMSYGQVQSYRPRDAIKYNYYTTLDGVIEKSYSNNPEYAIPSKLLEMYREKNFYPYSINDTMPVCFIATNHTSGGNSGSPVLNGDGYLIGINFDRNWEGTVGDYYFNTTFVRNISVDIRYILYLIDKYADAGYLLEEMNIIYEPEQRK